MKVYMKCRTKVEYDWFVKKYVTKGIEYYTWEAVEQRLKREDFEMCSENGKMGWNLANGYLKDHGFKQVFMFDSYLKEIER